MPCIIENKLKCLFITVCQVLSTSSPWNHRYWGWPRPGDATGSDVHKPNISSAESGEPLTLITLMLRRRCLMHEYSLTVSHAHAQTAPQISRIHLSSLALVWQMLSSAPRMRIWKRAALTVRDHGVTTGPSQLTLRLSAVLLSKLILYYVEISFFLSFKWSKINLNNTY